MNITNMNITNITNTNHNSDNELLLILSICSTIGGCCLFLVNCRRSFSGNNNNNNNNNNNKNTYDFSRNFNDIEQ